MALSLRIGFETARKHRARLDISGKTVATHRDQILDRLRLRIIADLTRYAIRAGIIEP